MSRFDSTSPSERPRVLHVVPALFGPDGVVGGAERYALELARAMARRVPTTLLTFGDHSRDESLDGLRLRVAGRPWYVRGQRSNPVAPALFPAVLRADVIHCHQHHVLASTLAAATARLRGRRVFVSDLGGGGWDLSAYWSTDRWFHGHLHISQYSRAVFGHADRPWARVILGGVDTERFSPDPAVGREPLVLFVGRLLPHKGVDDLIEAVPSTLRLELIGRPYDPGFLADLQRLAAGKNVVFRHDCDDQALVEAYRRARCVVLPSVYRDRRGRETRVPELLGQTLLEAMACGAPVIATRVASLPEVVDDGVTGFIVPPGAPVELARRITWLNEHPAQAASMGAAGRQRVLERFTWPEVVERCLTAYGAS